MSPLPSENSVESYVEALSGARSTAEIGAKLESVLKGMGFKSFAYVHVRPPLGKKLRSFVPPGSRSGNQVHEFLSTLPGPWVDHYLSQDYGDLDPTLQAAVSRLMPFQWREIGVRNDLSNGQRKVLNEARDHGVKDGATIPIHGPDSGLSTLSIVGGGGEREFQDAYQRSYRDLVWLAINTHEAFLNLAESAPDLGRVRLTDRERDCLVWTARGKTAWEVGQILSISEETVLFHLKNVTRKLGVFSKHHAVVKAVIQGYIVP
ncbi:helix-turn-helix transcriptional regulator [Pelagibius marinus]|uniref:helix-turn-helix transcriptional regulator n=1 Tax=Pelagibius marinus TaxID=2762760 RepID=UPI001872583B|nr:autoinducer binding domain-containing protein [Pelagibius marinus]